MSHHQPLLTVVSAQAFHQQIPAVTEYLETENVFPLRPAGMQLSHLSRGGAQRAKGVVFDGHGPESPRECGVDFREFAEEPPEKIERVNALIQQFAASAFHGIGAPFFGIPFPSAVPITAADMQQPPDASRIRQRSSFRYGQMAAMIEAGFKDASRVACRFHQFFGSSGIDGQRLFDQRMFFRLQRGQRYGTEPAVRRSYHHRVHVAPRDQFVHSRGSDHPEFVGHDCGACRIAIGYRHQARAGRAGNGFRALCANLSCADNPYAQSCHCSCGPKQTAVPLKILFINSAPQSARAGGAGFREIASINPPHGVERGLVEVLSGSRQQSPVVPHRAQQPPGNSCGFRRSQKNR